MASEEKARFRGFAVAVIATGAASALQLLAWPYIPPSPHLFYYPAVLVAAWLGGFLAGAVAVGLSALAINYWFLPPHGFSIATARDALELGIFAAMGLVLAWLMARTEYLRRGADRARKEAETARRKLYDAGLAREEMLAVVSHDLRSPINVVHLCASQILRTLPTTEGFDSSRRGAERVLYAAHRMDRLVRNLLDAATIDAGSLTIDVEDVSVSKLVDDTVELLRPLAERKSIRIDAEVKDSVILRCDVPRVLQVLENLVGNALKFVPQGGQVVVAVRVQVSVVLFEVRDSGPGIDTEQLPHIFDRFWHGERGGGSGLGLYIAKAVVEAHGGGISVTSNGGTTVSFTLPVHAALTTPLPHAAVHAAGPSA